jgi:hypothetical protein
MGPGFFDVLPEIAVMAAFGTVMMVIAIKTFNRIMTR